jgi:hypothetical protein
MTRGDEKKVHDEGGLQNKCSQSVIAIGQPYHEICGIENSEKDENEEITATTHKERGVGPGVGVGVGCRLCQSACSSESMAK